MSIDSWQFLKYVDCEAAAAPTARSLEGMNYSARQLHATTILCAYAKWATMTTCHSCMQLQCYILRGDFPAGAIVGHLDEVS